MDDRSTARDRRRMERRRRARGQLADVVVAWEDDHLLVVDKPAGVVVHPARGHRTGTLAQALAHRGASGGEEPWRAGIVHRLDRDTSGLLVVAKSDDVHRALKALLAARRLHREYLALVEGHPPARTGTIDAPIGRHRRDRVLMSIDTDEPREARTHYEIEQLLPHAAAAAGRARHRPHPPDPGSHGGDRPPGVRRPPVRTAGLYGLERQFLHAARLAFEHPVTARRSTCARRCRRIWRWRWRRRGGTNRPGRGELG